VLEPSDPGQSTVDPRIVNANTSGFAAFFTVDTTVPVIVATVLIVLGWLITLLPWEGQLVLRTQGAQSTEVVQQNQAEQQNNEVVLSSDAATQQWLSVSSPVTTPVRFAFIGPTFSHFSFYFVVTSAAISVRVHMLPYRYGLFWRSLEYGL